MFSLVNSDQTDRTTTNRGNSAVYQEIVKIVTENPSRIEDAEEVAKVITFMTGAGDVNSGTGFAALASEYTARMGALFFGEEFSAANLQKASNAIASEIFISILSPELRGLPTMDSIAEDDAAEAIGPDLYNNPEIPVELQLPAGDSGAVSAIGSGPAGWAGSLMFSLVNSDQGKH